MLKKSYSKLKKNNCKKYKNVTKKQKKVSTLKIYKKTEINLQKNIKINKIINNFELIFHKLNFKKHLNL